MNLASNDIDTDVAGLLAEPHVGVLALTPSGGGAPLVAPVWYAPTPGGTIVVATARGSAKLRMLRAGAPATFLVHRVAILVLRPVGWRFVDLTRAPASAAS